MKKKMPLICTIIFLLGIFVWSGITIKANESNIKFSNLYGERSELENVQFNLAKTKGIRMEDLIINSREIKSETSFSESGFDSIYSGFDVLDDKKFFRGLFITSETFYEDKDIKVDVTNKAYENNPYFKVRIKYKETNTYENFEVASKFNVSQEYNIIGISYENDKINILFTKNNNEDLIIFGEINVKTKSFNISEPIDLNKEFNIESSYLFSSKGRSYNGKVYFDIFEDDEEVNNKKDGNTILNGLLEININTKKINLYKPDEKINNEIKEIYKDGHKGQSYIQGDNIYFSFYDKEEKNISILAFNFNTKEFTFYRNLIEKYRFERYGVNFDDIGGILIKGNKVFLDLTNFNEEELVYYNGYISVVDINSKNPLYIGEYNDGRLRSISLMGGK
ncbi:hypothetical protein QTJ04_04885 [Clostridium perfringens]|uniref:hypothetical protein n=2 Tax=Clostridium perfringens TaxID=1502 RepID=UPI0013E322BD|nr:hypothetical protein [Clostridium perfringens]MCX0408854.1 hypothetical protein [Clostridium perfringens]MDM1005589.1 hypothetical protein [Clostridium perfringens]MDU5249883.1 hypothetical protein [Clostridium perfringens]NGT83933.1 hypothetical protein [Clostridium perfringens]BDA35112.1 hypothetical protein CPBEC5_21200 [Clostridium perfringens]